MAKAKAEAERKAREEAEERERIAKAKAEAKAKEKAEKKKAKQAKIIAEIEAERAENEGRYNEYIDRLTRAANDIFSPENLASMTEKEIKKMVKVMLRGELGNEEDYKANVKAVRSVKETGRSIKYWWNTNFGPKTGLYISNLNQATLEPTRNKVNKITFSKTNPDAAIADASALPKPTKVKKQKAGKGPTAAKGTPFKGPRGGNAKTFFSYDIQEIYKIIEEDLDIKLSDEAKLNIEALIFTATNELINSHGGEHGTSSKYDDVIDDVEDYINMRSRADHPFAFTGQRRQQFIEILKKESRAVHGTRTSRLNERILVLGKIL